MATPTAGNVLHEVIMATPAAGNFLAASLLELGLVTNTV